MLCDAAYALQQKYEQQVDQSDHRNKPEPPNATANLVGFRGLELLPSLDNKWLPGAFNDLQKRAGIAELSMGLTTITNACL